MKATAKRSATRASAPVGHPAREAKSSTARKATTVRLDPALQRGLALLQAVVKTPLNRLVNEAVRSYLERRSAEVEADLTQILKRVRAYRRSDPNFDKLWNEFVEAEARHGAEDPVEGHTEKTAGPAQSMVHELLRA
jgi:hypothetical protein